jgi:hypothetical protein
MSADWLIGAVALPVVGWVASIEYRLGVLLGMKKDLERLEMKTDMLVEHLIDRPTQEGSRKRRGSS